MMQELDRVHVPHRDSASVTFADVATISKIQAVFRGRIARRRREEEEAAVVAEAVSEGLGIVDDAASEVITTTTQ